MMDEMAATMDPELRKQVAGNHGTDDTDNDVSDQAESIAFHEQAREPARNRPDDQPSNKT